MQIIDETLRLGGIGIWLLREAKEDVVYQGTFSWQQFGLLFLLCFSPRNIYIILWANYLFSIFVTIDYVIPKGCFVVPFLSAVHLDENVYDGALNFNPWRWMDPKNQVGFHIIYSNDSSKDLYPIITTLYILLHV